MAAKANPSALTSFWPTRILYSPEESDRAATRHVRFQAAREAVPEVPREDQMERISLPNPKVGLLIDIRQGK
jgi:hypothetical protein